MLSVVVFSRGTYGMSWEVSLLFYTGLGPGARGAQAATARDAQAVWQLPLAGASPALARVSPCLAQVPALRLCSGTVCPRLALFIFSVFDSIFL